MGSRCAYERDPSVGGPLGTHWPLGTWALGDPLALGTQALGAWGPWAPQQGLLTSPSGESILNDDPPCASLPLLMICQMCRCAEAFSSTFLPERCVIRSVHAPAFVLFVRPLGELYDHGVRVSDYFKYPSKSHRPPLLNTLPFYPTFRNQGRKLKYRSNSSW